MCPIARSTADDWQNFSKKSAISFLQSKSSRYLTVENFSCCLVRAEQQTTGRICQKVRSILMLHIKLSSKLTFEKFFFF